MIKAINCSTNEASGISPSSFLYFKTAGISQVKSKRAGSAGAWLIHCRAPPPKYRAVSAYRHAALSELSSLDDILSALQAFQAAEPEQHFLCTLDDIRQCLYTSGHAANDLDAGDGDGADDEHADDRAVLRHLLQRFAAPDRLRWPQVLGELACAEDDLQALLHINRELNRWLDEVSYVLRVPVPSPSAMIAAMPNGYFSCDLDVFQNHAVIEHLQAQHGWRFFGIGASLLGFARNAPPTAPEAQALVADLRASDADLQASPVWAALEAELPTRRHLFLGYTEDMAGLVDLEEEGDEDESQDKDEDTSNA